MKKSGKFIFQKYDTENLINRRAALVTIAKAGVFSVLAGRLAYLQIAESSNYKKLSLLTLLDLYNYLIPFFLNKKVLNDGDANYLHLKH